MRPGERIRELVDAVVFDLDGVIWHEYTAIEGAADLVSDLRADGLQIAFLTNTSSRTEQFLTRKLAAVGIRTDPSLVFTSGRIAARFIAEERQGVDTVVVVHGARGVLRKQMENAGLTAVSLTDLASDHVDLDPHSDLVVALGYSRGPTHAEIATLLRLSSRVSKLYAPERDRWFGTAVGPKPGAGWIVAAAEEVLGQRAVVLGKPNPACLRTVAEALDVEVSRVLMVGDSFDSDIRAAKSAGSLSCIFNPETEGFPAADFSVLDMTDLRLLIQGRTTHDQ